jgi:UDP-glucose 4-epimerase
MIDNLSRSSKSVIDRIADITGTSPTFYQADLLDKQRLTEVFSREHPDAVIHFAALKEVGESVRHPLRYYRNNVAGSINLFDVMQDHDLRSIVFSSSCAVYGNPESVPISEEAPLQPISPYGRTKACVEQVLRDLAQSDSRWNTLLLRYFNPIGAHPSGKIGQFAQGEPSTLLPYITKVANGELKELSVFGDDYPTRDGTPVRDYIHIMDLVEGHLSALEELSEEPGIEAYNLGTGTGYSVLEVIETFEEATGQQVPYSVSERREGDVVRCFANPSKAIEELDWRPERNLYDMCLDAWNWTRNQGM